MAMPLAATWDLVFLCNYRCPYCFIKWHDGGIGVLHTAVTPDDWVAFWERMHRDHGVFDITIAGGEPFVYPGIVPMLQRITRWHDVNVNTNLSWNPEIVYGILSPERVKLSASFHPHYADFERFISCVIGLKSNGYRLMTTVVAYPPLFEKLTAYRDAFEKHRIGYFFLPFQGKLGDREYPRDYTVEQKRFLYGGTVLTEEVMAQPMKDRPTRGRLCAAGQRRFRLAADGHITRCFPSANMGEPPIGHIRDRSFKMWDAPAPCPAENCFCPEEYSYLLDLNLKDTLSVETLSGRR